MTQAVVSVRRDGKVVMKLVCGCCGTEARTLAAALRALGRVPTLPEGLQMAANARYGCPACIAAVTPELTCLPDGEYRDETEYPWLMFYRTTFDDPNFNPRWALGTADYVEIVDF
jgi:hypothetical protein